MLPRRDDPPEVAPLKDQHGTPLRPQRRIVASLNHCATVAALRLAEFGGMYLSRPGLPEPAIQHMLVAQLCIPSREGRMRLVLRVYHQHRVETRQRPEELLRWLSKAATLWWTNARLPPDNSRRA